MRNTHIFIFILLVAMLLFNPLNVSAEEKINSFESEVVVYSDGTMEVVENIKYDFGEGERHGIFRYIPLSQKVGDLYKHLKISFKEISRDGKKEDYEASNEFSFLGELDNKVSVKIGDPDRTITGVHDFTISYSVKNGITNFEDHDELFWNVTGNGWGVPIEYASFEVRTEAGEILDIKCFTGSLGSTEQDCVGLKKEGKAEFDTTNLDPYEGLTIVTSFPVNTFPKTELSKYPVGISKWVLGLIGIGVLAYYVVLPLWIFIWYLKNKRKNRFGKPAVNFDFPVDDNKKRITPAEAGTIDSAKLEKDDVTATIFDLAIRKYLTLKDEINKKFLGTETKHWIIKTSKDTSGLNLFEKKLYDRIFKKGDKVEVKELGDDFYVTFKGLQDLIFGSLVARGLYTKNPANQRAGFIALGIISLVTLNIFLAWLAFWFAKVMNGRTENGDKEDWEVDGLKIFLKNMDRYYTFQVKNLITVEKYIPYAIALGYMDEFMASLKTVAPDYNPGWYSGGSSNYNFYSFYPAFSSSVTSNVTTTAPSSSSGFSGGGSSGGGGGGGGGGSW